MKTKEMGIFQYNFKRLLDDKGWDLAACADASGIAIGSLKKYSAGYREPDLEFRKILEQTFQVETFEFYRPKNGAIPVSPKHLSELTESQLKDALKQVLQELPQPTVLDERSLQTLAQALKIPSDLLALLSIQGPIYFNSLKRELQNKGKKKEPSKTSASS